MGFYFLMNYDYYWFLLNEIWLYGWFFFKMNIHSYMEYTYISKLSVHFCFSIVFYFVWVVYGCVCGIVFVFCCFNVSIYFLFIYTFTWLRAAYFSCTETSLLTRQALVQRDIQYKSPVTFWGRVGLAVSCRVVW